MFGFFKNLFPKAIDAKDYLRKTKTLDIKGILFTIKRITIEDHLSGLNVILNIHQSYKVATKESAANFDDLKAMRKFMRDIIFAGVVKPKLTMVKNPGDVIHIDEVINDMELAQILTKEIISYSYGKKK